MDHGTESLKGEKKLHSQSNHILSEMSFFTAKCLKYFQNVTSTLRVKDIKKFSRTVLININRSILPAHIAANKYIIEYDVYVLSLF